MARLPDNVERNPLYRRTYIGYDRDGYAFRITPTDGGWTARPSHAAASTDWRRFEGKTLAIVAHVIGRTTLPASDGSN